MVISSQYGLLRTYKFHFEPMSFSTVPNTTLTLRQQILRRKLDDDLVKALNHPAVAAIERIAHAVANSGDWTIQEYPVKHVPQSLCQLIPLQLRDLGNELIEETRELNNNFIGHSFRSVEVMLATDPHLLNLRWRIQQWGEQVAGQVNFKLRHQARNDPVRTFLGAFDTFISFMDTKIAHSNQGLYQLAWGPLPDLLGYQLLDAMLLKPGHCKVVHDSTPVHNPHLKQNFSLQSQHDRDRFTSILSIYAVEPVAYLEKVVLVPLLSALRADTVLPPHEQQRVQFRQMFADLNEVAPYLLSSDRAERYMFSIPGTTCVAALSFISPFGCARIVFSDDVASLRSGLHTNFVRGALSISYDGKFSWWMHPWRTLDTVFDSDAVVALSFWLLKQVHELLVKDYLSIEHYYLDEAEPEADETSVSLAEPDEALRYVAWAKALEVDDMESNGSTSGSESEAPTAEVESYQGTLPQLRRRFFFKLLEQCGAHIEQGKGSEIKLLRKNKRPFRLGNHYGKNPTIPAFLAADILKRLEITKEEWIAAITAG